MPNLFFAWVLCLAIYIYIVGKVGPHNKIILFVWHSSFINFMKIWIHNNFHTLQKIFGKRGAKLSRELQKLKHAEICVCSPLLGWNFAHKQT